MISKGDEQLRQSPGAPLSHDARVIIETIERTEARHKQSEAERHVENQRRLDALAQEQRQMKVEIAGITRGFPDGDPDSHRRYHESVIEWRELRNKMVREALMNAAKVGGVMGLGWVAYAVWVAMKMEIMK